GAWPASALTLMRETTEAVRALLRGERVTVDGRYVKLDDVVLDVPPEVVPPIVAGVRGHRSLELAGQVMDGVLLAEPSTPEYIAAMRSQVGVADGAEFLLPTYNFAVVDDDEERAIEIARPSVATLRGADWETHIEPLPFAQQWRELDAANPSDADFAAALPAEWITALALVGTPDRIKARIEELFAAGATSVSMFPQ